MITVNIYITNNDLCKSFLVILKNQLNSLNKKYIFKFFKINDPKKIVELKSKGITLPSIKVNDKTISNFDNCAKFVRGQVKHATTKVPSNELNMHDHICNELWNNRNIQCDSIGDVMDDNEVKKKMRDRMNHQVSENIKRKINEDDEGDENGDMFDKAMRETKIDNIDTSSDLNLQGVEWNSENDLMMKHLMNNVSS